IDTPTPPPPTPAHLPGRLNPFSRAVCVAFALGALTLVGCSGTPMPTADAAAPDYARPLAPGQPALRRVSDPSRHLSWDELARQAQQPGFRAALNRSRAWFTLPSSPTHFPRSGIAFDHAKRSVDAFAKLIEQYPDAVDQAALSAALADRFDVYMSVGWDNAGTVLFTAYYSPEFTASKTPDAAFRYPLYQRPADLVSDPRTGEVFGRATSAGYELYPTRAQLFDAGVLTGTELVYLPTRLDAYLIEVNGSAKLNMTDGSTMYVGHAGTNGRDYTSIGRELVADGKLDPATASLPTLKAHFERFPDELPSYIRRNDRMVFFKEYPGSDWPAGSLGFTVTPYRTVATDKAIFPRGGVTFATVPDQGIRLLMLDQDTGGAIRAPGRADLYFGIGAGAEADAGRVAHEGYLFYLLLQSP
ncbi:MAG: MltA domain-containing protein, partial [Planctomycetota bacterium]